MASAIYPKALDTIGAGGINLLSDTLKVCLVDTGTYTYNAAHQYRSSLTGVAGGTHPTLGTKTLVNGTFDAADTTCAAVTAGASVEAAIVYRNTGAAGTDNLIAYIEFTTYTPNGSDLLLTWSGSGLFTL